jgi:hypothetical protein
MYCCCEVIDDFIALKSSPTSKLQPELLLTGSSSGCELLLTARTAAHFKATARTAADLASSDDLASSGDLASSPITVSLSFCASHPAAHTPT